jgi:DNA-binding MarR family transcriptional regulator
MPAERTIMRQVREVLRLKFVGGVSIREIARRIGVAASTVLDRKAPPRVRKPLPRNDQWRMGAKERITLELITAHLRRLERQGFVVSSLDADGRVRWRITEKDRREDPNEMDSRLDLDS